MKGIQYFKNMSSLIITMDHCGDTKRDQPKRLEVEVNKAGTEVVQLIELNSV